MDLDLSECEKEPIHLISAIQPHGLLLSFSKQDHIIEQISVNTEKLLGLNPTEFIGKKLEDLIDHGACNQIAEAMSNESLTGMRPLDITFPSAKSEQSFVGTLHSSEDLFVLECEPNEHNVQNNSAVLSIDALDALTNLSNAANLADLLARSAKTVQEFSDFDRVLIYKFDDQWNGTVVAEHKRDNMPSLAHHCFPASDIPKQARELYVKNWIRLLVDVNASPVSIVPKFRQSTSSPLDLSYSILRSMSAVHIEYLKNMGVSASMSISVIVDEKLWALIACHNRTPKGVDPYTRRLCVFLAQLLSTLVSRLDETENTKYALSLKRIQQKVLRDLSSCEDLVDGLLASSEDILALTGARGFAVFFDGRTATIGIVPTSESLSALRTWLDTLPPQIEPLCSRSLSSLYDAAKAFPELASGLLAAPLPNSGDWLVWFRPEVIEEITWAGNPSAPALLDTNTMRIHPRKSFESWNEQVRGLAKPWCAAEIKSAVNLRSNLLDFVLGQFLKRRLCEVELQEQRDRFHAQRENWLAALAHDLQTPAIGASRLLEMILSGALGVVPEQLQRPLEILQDASSGQLARIKTLLDVFHFETERTLPALQSIEVEPLLLASVQQLAPLAIAKDIEVRTTVSQALPSVLCDESALRRVLINLLDNAIKFSSTHSTVELIADSADNQIRLYVKDSGPGIPEEDRKHLFERFWQGGVAKKYHTSIGLGLYLCRQITTSMGGEIVCDSTLGKGTTFTVTLPIAQATISAR